MPDMDGACGECGLDLSGVADERPQIELSCNHDGTLGLVVHPDDATVQVSPGEALEIKWALNYPEDGGPPTLREIGGRDEHWGAEAGDHRGAVPGDGAGGNPRTLEAFAAGEGTNPGLIPDSFEKMTGYRAWIMTNEDGLRSTAHSDHVWSTTGPEVAICQKEKDGHHVSFELFRLRQQADALPEDDPRKVTLQAAIDREIMVARRSPERNCQCGIYAVHEPEQVAPIIGRDGQPNIVYGRVKVYGKIADYEHGFRAEKVDIDCLFRPKGWSKRRRVARVAKKYGAHVEKAPVSLPDPDFITDRAGYYTWVLVGGGIGSHWGTFGFIGGMTVGLIGWLTYSTIRNR